MHAEVIEWVREWATADEVDVLDIGGRDLNGSTRHLFPNARYTVLDLRPGKGVDVVADAATWTPDRTYDVVLCTEVFEHTPDWRAIVATAYAALKPGGRFIATCAGPGRAPHSGIEATAITPGEYYANVSVTELYDALTEATFLAPLVQQQRHDTRAVAHRPGPEMG